MAAEPLSPFCPPLQTEICEAVCADGRKARTLNWTKPQPYLDDEGTQPRLQYAKKKKGKKKEKKGWGGRKKNMNHFSQELGRMCEYEWMTVRQSGVVEKELTARSKSEFLDEGGNSSASVATVVRLPLVSRLRGSKAQLNVINNVKHGIRFDNLRLI